MCHCRWKQKYPLPRNSLTQKPDSYQLDNEFPWHYYKIHGSDHFEHCAIVNHPQKKLANKKARRNGQFKVILIHYKQPVGTPQNVNQ